MTRRITYANQLANSLFAMQDQKELMLALGFLAQAILGTTTELDGFDCTPNSPADMTVLLGQGSIFEYVDVDATAFGELPSQIPADTTDQILKYASNLSTYQTAPFVPPSTPGFSRNDLIQIGFNEADGDSENIPFWGGVTNVTINGVSVPVPNPISSQTKNVRRITSVVINIKQGTAAATGTQTTPTPDAGYVGAWVITTTQGQTSITSGDIAEYTNAPFITEKLKDKISQTTADARYAQLTQFASSIVGYQRFPSGIIFQWGGFLSLGAGSNAVANYPVTFPNQAIQAFATPGLTVDSTTPVAGAVQFVSNSQIRIYNCSTITASFNWLAIGY